MRRQILNNKNIAIVGCRECTEYGKKAAKYFSYNLSKENINIVKDDIYHKIQKLLFYTILILSTYYTIKIIADRYDLMNHIEAQESIRKQEKELRNA